MQGFFLYLPQVNTAVKVSSVLSRDLSENVNVYYLVLTIRRYICIKVLTATFKTRECSLLRLLFANVNKTKPIDIQMWYQNIPAPNFNYLAYKL